MNLLDRLVAIWRRDLAQDIESLPAPTGLSRRRFLQILSGSAAVIAAAPLVDLERLVWTPGQLVAVPAMPARLSGNSFITPEWITREALRLLQNQLTFTTAINREYDDRFAMTGATIRVTDRRRVQMH